MSELRNCVRHSHTWAEIYLPNIRYNLIEINRRLPSRVRFMAAVKANGYGHGAVQAAKASLEAGADALAVGLLDEAVQLRESGIDAPILIITPIRPCDVDLAVKYDLTLSVFQAAWIKEMRKYKNGANKLRVHLKMDTGMGRFGMTDKDQFDELVPHLQSDDINVEGVYTHFATANQADVSFVCKQFKRFLQMQGWVHDAGFRGFISHCANSATAIRYPEMALDMVRVGASLYGIMPFDDEVRETLSISLKPTLSLHTEIVHVKRVSKGSYISYDSSYQASSDEWIATLPIGYADGWFRGYKGGHVLVDGRKQPIVGNICMDHTMVRLSDYTPPGTQVTLIGKQYNSEITLDDMANRIGSIPQQVLAMIAERVPRIYLAEPAPRHTLPDLALAQVKL